MAALEMTQQKSHCGVEWQITPSINSYSTSSYFAVGPGQSCLAAAACRLSILYSSARTCSIMDLCLVPDAVSTSPILHFAFMYQVNCDWIVDMNSPILHFAFMYLVNCDWIVDMNCEL
ncbi:unnamed protein product [Prunus armeniaca]|uniref:Uncharacterized protein n=1 Tax=Prunus armeniaca TaxID=36596 RepID=A0A6J5U5V8_PRUAR|nr:unnamed protein product [Prunus armeniaca]CAB4301395.1 unnamed protein product [Prunus armeniaca]